MCYERIKRSSCEGNMNYLLIYQVDLTYGFIIYIIIRTEYVSRSLSCLAWPDIFAIKGDYIIVLLMVTYIVLPIYKTILKGFVLTI